MKINKHFHTKHAKNTSTQDRLHMHTRVHTHMHRGSHAHSANKERMCTSLYTHTHTHTHMISSPQTQSQPSPQTQSQPSPQSQSPVLASPQAHAVDACSHSCQNTARERTMHAVFLVVDCPFSACWFTSFDWDSCAGNPFTVVVSNADDTCIWV